MKIKLIFFLLVFVTCSNGTVFNEIEIDNEVFDELINLDTREKILIDTSNLIVINYWASWCLECIEEHEFLIQLSNTKGFENRIFLVLFQDSRQNALTFLNNYGRGNISYLLDPDSKLSINSGVFGVPETHIIQNNKIIKKYIGPLSITNLQEIIISYSNEGD